MSSAHAPVPLSTTMPPTNEDAADGGAAPDATANPPTTDDSTADAEAGPPDPHDNECSEDAETLAFFTELDAVRAEMTMCKNPSE